jgi:hypothetical protein
MAVVQRGIKVVFGIPKIILPIKVAPGARVQFKFKPMHVARAIVQHGKIKTEHVIIDKETHWQLSPPDWKVLES